MIFLQCMECLPEVSVKLLAEQAVLDSRLTSLLDTLQDLCLGSLLCNGSITQLDVTLISSNPSVGLVIDDPV